MLWGFLGFESRLPFPVWGRSEPFCRDLAVLSTKWLWDRFSSLQNGNYGLKRWPYKMALPVNCLGSFSPTTILTCSSKKCQTCAFMFLKKKYLKNPGPFCRASTSPGHTAQTAFFPLPFCRAKPCQSSFLDEAGSCFMQLLQADKVDILVPTMC